VALSGRRSGYEAVLFRRFMLRTAAQAAARVGAASLITGDSLGQVASQTMDNLVSAGDAVDTPILRPLIGSNKQEIIELARRIGTYDISIEPYKDCCALIAQHPRTRSTPERMRDLEAEIDDYDGIVERTLADMVELRYDCGRYAE
jgi:thiamine biosynthesis protein ThiI